MIDCKQSKLYKQYSLHGDSIEHYRQQLHALNRSRAIRPDVIEGRGGNKNIIGDE